MVRNSSIVNPETSHRESLWRMSKALEVFSEVLEKFEVGGFTRRVLAFHGSDSHLVSQPLSNPSAFSMDNTEDSQSPDADISRIQIAETKTSLQEFRLQRQSRSTREAEDPQLTMYASRLDDDKRFPAYRSPCG